MVQVYCQAHHGTRGPLCPECQSLCDYALGRLDRCPFGAEKTTCADCPTHCYKPALRDQVKTVMRMLGLGCSFITPSLPCSTCLTSEKTVAASTYWPRYSPATEPSPGTAPARRSIAIRSSITRPGLNVTLNRLPTMSMLLSSRIGGRRQVPVMPRAEPWRAPFHYGSRGRAAASTQCNKATEIVSQPVQRVQPRGTARTHWTQFPDLITGRCRQIDATASWGFPLAPTSSRMVFFDKEVSMAFRKCEDCGNVCWVDTQLKVCPICAVAEKTEAKTMELELHEESNERQLQPAAA